MSSLRRSVSVAAATSACVLSLASLSTLGAQAPGRQAPPRAAAASPFVALPGANVVSVVASDYALQMPATLPAGLTTLRLSNTGKELHHLYLVKVEKGKKPEDVLAWFKKGGPPPAWMRPVGGPNASAPMPGAETLFTSNLTAGDYIAVRRRDCRWAASPTSCRVTWCICRSTCPPATMRSSASIPMRRTASRTLCMG
jgi:hypothetical protein